MNGPVGARRLPEAAAAEEDPRVLQMERWLARMLQAGVWGSAALVLVGLAVSALGGRGPADLAGLVRPPPGFAPTPAWLAADLAAGGGQGLVLLGLVLLIATPVLRVALSIGLFARQGDRAYVIITSGVLALLLVSFLLGRAGG